MKKAKILLTAVSILSVIAGTFAFKTQHKFNGRFFCTTLRGTTTYFITRYTSTNIGGITFYCSIISTATKTITYKVITVI
jgi:hypothetical protein